MVLPGVEYGSDIRSLDIDSDDQGVAKHWALIGTAFDLSPAMRSEIVATFEKRWGPPEKQGARLVFSHEPWIAVDDDVYLTASAWLEAPPGLDRGAVVAPAPSPAPAPAAPAKP